jgi:hypothetical protein
MTPRVAAALAAASCVMACSSEPFRGGYTTPEARPPRVKTLAAFLPGHCEDAAREDLAPRIASVEIVETATGRTLLLEHREGHDLLIVENHFDSGADWVFQVLVKADGLVRQWRIPRSFGATGSLLIGREITEVTHGEHFEAGLASAVLACSLVPRSSDLPRGSTNPVP